MSVTWKKIQAFKKYCIPFNGTGDIIEEKKHTDASDDSEFKSNSEVQNYEDEEILRIN